MSIFNLDHLDSIRFCALFTFRYIRIKGYFHDFVLLELSHSLLTFTRFRKQTLYCVYFFVLIIMFYGFDTFSLIFVLDLYHFVLATCHY